jgi:hypothetical protein
MAETPWPLRRSFAWLHPIPRFLAFMDTPTPLEDDPAQLWQRAECARCEADFTSDPIAREALIAIAIEYENLAALAEAKLTSRPAKDGDTLERSSRK